MALPTRPSNIMAWMTSAASTANISVPTGSKQNTGWLADEKPAAEIFNGLFYTMSLWDEYLNDLGTEIETTGWITSSMIAGSAITTAKIQDSAVTSDKLGGSAVTTPKLGDYAVTNPKLGNSAVHEFNIQNSAVTTDKLADLAVNANKIAISAVVTTRLQNSAVTTAKLGDISVTTAKIKTGTSEFWVAGNSSANYTLTGGLYCFMPAFKQASANVSLTVQNCYEYATTTAYVTTLHVLEEVGNSAAITYNYITSSGREGWVYIWRDKITKNRKAVNIISDPVCFGQKKAEALEHPFPDYNEATDEIVVCVIDESDWIDIKIDRYENDKSYWKAILDNYEIDESEEVDYPNKEFDINSGSNDYLLIEHDKEKYGKPKKQKIKKPNYIKCYKLKKKHGGE